MRRLLGSCLVSLACAGLLAADEPDGKTIHLFNGKDLTNFYTYLGAPAKGEKPCGKNHDPKKVFTVQDGMIRVSGEVFGGLTTDKEYGNYHLVVEYKWGEQTFPPRKDRGRDSGVFLHCTGRDGAVIGAWMEGIECNVMEGSTGDFILVGPKNRFSCTATVIQQPAGPEGMQHMEYYYRASAPPVDFTSGRINWFGRDPLFKDVKNFRGTHDVENKVGDWNRLECICHGNKITAKLNGVTMNEITNTSVAKGKIMLQSEGAEILFRKIDLLPLTK
jgi:hypothetical protein